SAVTVNSANDYAFSGIGAISGAAALSKLGTGALTLITTNTYGGGTTLTGGRLNINNASAISAGLLSIGAGTQIGNTGAGPITLINNNPIIWGTDFTFAGSNDLNLGLGAVTMTNNCQVTASANTLTVGGIISGTGYGLTKNDVGTLLLASNNTFTGASTVNGGTLQVGVGTAAGTAGTGAVTINSPGILKFYRSDGYTIPNAISGAGTLYLQGTGLLGQSDYPISGLNTMTAGGLIVVDRARIQMDNLTDIGSAAINVLTGGGIYMTANVAIPNALTLNGIGWWEGTAPNFLGALRMTTGNWSGPITLNGPGYNRVSTWGGNAIISGVISGPGGLEFLGEATNARVLYVCVATNTYQGGTKLTASGAAINTLWLGNNIVGNENANALGTGPVTINPNMILGFFPGSTPTVYNIPNAIILAGGYIHQEDGNQHLIGPITVAADSFVRGRYADKSFSLDGVISGNSKLSLSDTGTANLYFTNSANTYSGTLTALTNAVYIYVRDNTALQYAKVDMAGTTANFIITATNPTPNVIIAGLMGTGASKTYNADATPRTLTINNAADYAYAGTLGDGTLNGNNLALAKTGPGKLTLSAANPYTNGTTVANGTLYLTNTTGSGTGTNAVTVNAGARLDGTGIVSGAVTAAGTVAGSGTYNGSVTVSGLLTGREVINGAAAVSGTLDPAGPGTTGVLTINNTLNLTGNMMLDVTKAGGALTCDQVAGMTGATLGGTISVSATGDPLAEGDAFQIFSGAFPFTGAMDVITSVGVPGLLWDTSALAATGILSVIAYPAPVNLALATADDTGIYDNDGITNKNSVSIIGQGALGQTVSIYEGAAFLGSGLVAGGNFSVGVTLAEGAHSVYAITADIHGNVSTPSASLLIVVDNTNPAAPTAALDPADDTGLSNSDGITMISSGLTIAGACESPAVVVIYDGGTSIVSEMVTTNSYIMDIAIAPNTGLHAVTVNVMDLAGNWSLYSLAVNITVDQTLPALTSTNPSDGARVGMITTVTINLSETVGGVTVDKLTVSSGSETWSAVGMAQTGPTQYGFAFDDVFGSGPVSLVFNLYVTSGSSTVTDVAGNLLSEVGTSWTLIKDARVIPIDIAAPLTPYDSWTSLSAVPFVATFNEAMTGFDPGTTPSQLLLTNCVFTTGSSGGSGAVYSFSVSPLVSGLPVTVKIPAGGCNPITPPTNRFNGDSNIWRFLYDNVGPSFINLVVTPNYAAVGTTTTLTFSAIEPLAPGSQPIVTVNGNNATFRNSSGPDLNYTYDYAIQSLDAEGTATVSITGLDRAYNSGTSVFGTGLFVDRTNPTVDILSVPPDLGPQIAQIVFSEPVTGMAQVYLTLTRNSVPIAFSAFTQVSSSLYTVVVPNDMPGIYVLTVSATPNVKDNAGLPLVVGTSEMWIISPSSSMVESWTRY
ncbi:MAG: Ig-like domain-containing protein, partial [Candidatus Sumerlaeota bacterium]|nr:Ig-like domain-containing protein [Candidatus Sumerlaeota bacterium]